MKFLLNMRKKLRNLLEFNKNKISNYQNLLNLKNKNKTNLIKFSKKETYKQKTKLKILRIRKLRNPIKIQNRNHLHMELIHIKAQIREERKRLKINQKQTQI